VSLRWGCFGWRKLGGEQGRERKFAKGEREKRGRGKKPFTSRRGKRKGQRAQCWWGLCRTRGRGGGRRGKAKLKTINSGETDIVPLDGSANRGLCRNPWEMPCNGGNRKHGREILQFRGERNRVKGKQRSQAHHVPRIIQEKAKERTGRGGEYIILVEAENKVD